MSISTQDDNICPIDHPYCFNEPIGKKEILTTCQGEKYDPTPALEFLSSNLIVDEESIKSKGVHKQCDNLCSCKQYD